MSLPIVPFVVVAAAAGLALGAAPALAEQVNYNTSLSAKDEVPPNDSTGTGTVTATYDTVSNILNWTIEYADLTGPATAAHFHGPTAPGGNAPSVVPIEGSLESPLEGEATLTDAQAEELRQGMWYFNVHTDAHPDGEIRGQLTPDNPD